MQTDFIHQKIIFACFGDSRFTDERDVVFKSPYIDFI